MVINPHGVMADAEIMMTCGVT
jgi:hypothetical protein